MSRITISLVSTFIALAATSCASSPAPEVLIDYRLNDGLLGIDHESLLVNVKGRAAKSYWTSNTVTTASMQLDAATFSDLNRKISDAQFPILQPYYGRALGLDIGVFIIDAQIDHTHYVVELDADLRVTIPDSLLVLLTTLRELATP